MRDNIGILRVVRRAAMAAFYWARTHVLKFATLSLLCGSAILLLKMFPPNATFEFKPDAVQREQGHAYVVSVVQMSDRVWALKSDGIGGHRSQLRLYEDGREFGAAHSSHPDIRSAGRGQYSHWGGGLFFSTPDDSDPRTNGRVYRAIAPLELVPSIAALGWLLAFLGGAVLVRRGVAAAADAPPGLRVDRAVKRILVASELRRGVVAVALASGAAAGIGALLYAWRYGDVASTSFDLFRFLPVSDALGYHNCATTLAASGSFDSSTAGWCSRRVLYPAMLASLLGVSGWSHQVVLLLQAALVGVAVAACALAVRQRYGVLAAAIMLVALIAFAWEHVIGLFVTEVAGFILGLTALCLFLAYGSRRFLLLLFVACAFLSVGLTARAGALFVFPAVALWALLTPAASIRLRLQTLAVAVAGLLVGPALQYGVVASVGGDLTNTGANFSTSLYGLSTGSRDWSQAYQVFANSFAKGEEDAFRQIYRAAIANISGNPAVFARALFDAEIEYLSTLFDVGWLSPIGPLLALLAAAGLAVCIKNAARVEYGILAFVAAGELIAAPLIFDSGGTRVFAVTFPFRALLAGIGAAWLLGMYRVSVADRSHPDGLPGFGPTAAATLLGTAVIAAMVTVTTPVAKQLQLAAVSSARTCPEGVRRVVAHLGAESQMLGVTRGGVPSFFPLRVDPERLKTASATPRPMQHDVLSVPPGSYLILAVDRAPGQLGAVVPLLLAEADFIDGAQPVTLCANESDGPNLVGVTYRRVTEYARIAGK